MKTEVIGKYPIRVPTVKNPIKTPKDEINLHALVGFFGMRGSGKSVSCFSKVRDLKEQGYADRVFLISPTRWSNYELARGLVDDGDQYESMTCASVDDILAKIEQETQEYEEYLENLELYKLWHKLERRRVPIESIDPDLLLKFDERGIMYMEEPPRWKYPNAKNGIGIYHLVVDDAMGSPLFTPSTKNTFLNMLTRHRHVSSRPNLKVGLSVWLLMQAFTAQAGGIPRAIRANLTHICIFPVKQQSALENIADEVGECDREQFLKAYKVATSEPHSFLLIDFNPKDKNRVFRKRWDEYIMFD